MQQMSKGEKKNIVFDLKSIIYQFY